MSAQVVCFGEMLWDLLPNGEQPGGAPMNVAYHLAKQGITPAMISRIGADDYGSRLQQLIAGWGLSTQWIQQDAQYPTGMVHAYPNERHEVTYEIVQPAAWDFIAWEDQLQKVVQGAGYFVYGSLSARSATSRETLFRLLKAANKKVFDVNIRPPFFKKEVALKLLKQVHILKLNEHELPVISGWIKEGGSINEQIKHVQDHFQIPIVVVTRGAAGALLRTESQTYTHPGYKVLVADTVGSGDAFLAGLISQLRQGRAPDDALAFACATGAFVATKTGACPEYAPEAIRHLMAQVG